MFTAPTQIMATWTVFYVIFGGLEKQKDSTVLYLNAKYLIICDGFGTGGPIIFAITHYCMIILV